MKDYKIEICCGSLTDCVTASRFPIARIELNSALELGGLTPSLAELIKCKETLSVPVVCMVRPRPAGFIYNSLEISTMFLDAEILLKNGADGIVFGFLNADHSVDLKHTLAMSELIHSYGKEAIFHRAFDETNDPYKAIEDLINCKIDRVLTSGHEADALKGAPLLNELIRNYGHRIQILPGCGIKADNIIEILKITNADQFHMTAKMKLHDSEDYFAVSSININDVINTIKVKKSCKHNSELTGEDIELLNEDIYEEGFQFIEDERR